ALGAHLAFRRRLIAAGPQHERRGQESYGKFLLHTFDPSALNASSNTGNRTAMTLSHSSAVTAIPSRSRLVTPNSGRPQGTIPEKWDKSGDKLTENPCIVTQRRTRTPIAPILASRPSISVVQMPTRSGTAQLSTPNSLKAAMTHRSSPCT